jgi:hypothetical protein
MEISAQRRERGLSVSSQFWLYRHHRLPAATLRKSLGECSIEKGPVSKDGCISALFDNLRRLAGVRAFTEN